MDTFTNATIDSESLWQQADRERAAFLENRQQANEITVADWQDNYNLPTPADATRELDRMVTAGTMTSRSGTSAKNGRRCNLYKFVTQKDK